jgi:hypothetical protein
LIAAIGPAPAIRKNACAAIHIASGGAVALNTTRRAGMGRRASRLEMTRQSIATVTVPAAGPNSSAAAMVKLSEIEKLTGVPGSRSVADPLSAVRPSSTNQRSSIGAPARLQSDPRMMKPPTMAIAGRNIRSRVLLTMSITRGPGADTRVP